MRVNKKIEKRWYQSRLIRLGGAAVLGAVADGVMNNWGWRQIVVVAIGAVVVILRADTNTGVTK